MSDAAFYLAQANQQREAAGQATLANVRERCERAARAWSDLATRGKQPAPRLLVVDVAEGLSENPDRGLADG